MPDACEKDSAMPSRGWVSQPLTANTNGIKKFLCRDISNMEIPGFSKSSTRKILKKNPKNPKNQCCHFQGFFKAAWEHWS